MTTGSRESAGGWLELPDPMEESGSTADIDPIKPAPLIALYERLLADLRHAHFVLLELGVKNGDSLVMWRDAFPNATIVGLDLEIPDVEMGERVHMYEGSQDDREVLERIGRAHAPEGFDIVIDDASHLGRETAASLRYLFNPHLRPGGRYIIEDWFTGYTDWWSDGRAAEESSFKSEALGRTRWCLGRGTRFPGHEFGTDGVIKQVIDQMAAPLLPWFAGGGKGVELAVSSLTIEGGAVILTKSDSVEPQPLVEG